MARSSFTEGTYKNHPWFKALVRAFAACKSEEDTAALLRDIATLSELSAFAERLEVAKLLSTGKSYRAVAAATGASTTTVTRVAKFLQGDYAGYHRVLGLQKGSSEIQASANARGEPHRTGGVQKAGALRKYLEEK